MTPRPKHPTEIKTPPTSIGIYEHERSARTKRMPEDPPDRFAIPENEGATHMNLITIGALCGIIALIILLVILL